MSGFVFESTQELSKLAIQAKAWAPAAARALDEIGVRPGSTCVDLGCGAMGILPLLAERVGPHGKVFGLDKAPELLAAARALAEAEGYSNVGLILSDLWDNRLVPGTFDLVHARFFLPHVGNAKLAVEKMVQLAKPGGVIFVQEREHSSWNFYPPLPEWQRLFELSERTMQALGVDINVGQRTFHLLRDAGLEGVTVRAAVIALQDSDPYMRLALTATATIRQAILRTNPISADELDALLVAIERHIEKPDTYMIGYTTTQVWGRRPLQPQVQ